MNKIKEFMDLLNYMDDRDLMFVQEALKNKGLEKISIVDTHTNKAVSRYIPLYLVHDPIWYYDTLVPEILEMLEAFKK